ncbi:MBL fold metallo-hydrolase [Edaphobacter aggregans]|uniref:MBL fold metallo-hydrolase n=1 Tax=Edaphobacter aggregans TaxID=570835 RepID=UPI00054DF26B|nr:MBL fold metallo-hydrolase [Edaphobacter aggregans]
MLVTRRHFLATTAAAATCFASRSLFAQQEPQQPEMVLKARAGAASAKITTQKLRGNISVVQGSGGNIAVLSGPQGKLLVDSGISSSQPHIQEALAAISADPIQHLINTHWHYDHTDGNLWMHSAGATIIAHEKTRQRLASPQKIELFHATFPSEPAGALPTLIFTGQHTLQMNGNTLYLEHYDPAHTDTDISVHFADADVLHTGDTWFNGVYPFIDYSTGGHIDGMIRATKRTLATGTTSTIVIPGHGPVGDKQQVSESLEMLSAIRDKVADLRKQGKSIDETIAAKPTVAFDEKWGKGFTTPEMFTRFVYQGV